MDVEDIQCEITAEIMLTRGWHGWHGNSGVAENVYDAAMAELVQFGIEAAACTPARPSRTVLWLQLITLAWMLVECGVSIYAAKMAHSPALLPFGSDSFVELLSASVVLAQWIPGISIAERRASRLAGGLLFLLAVLVAGTAVTSLVLRAKPEASGLGMAITIAALLAMPALAWLKRREARRSGNRALAADAVQSATCAYLALITLVGLAVNAIFHIEWIDSVAALVAVPILIHEGRMAWRGQSCACC